MKLRSLALTAKHAFKNFGSEAYAHQHPLGSDACEYEDLGVCDTIFERVHRLLCQFNIEYLVSQVSRRHIPTEGRVIIVADFPVGHLNALSLFSLLGENRRDVRLVSASASSSFSELNHYIITLARSSVSTQRTSIRSLLQALQENKAVVVFPPLQKNHPHGLRARASKKKWYRRIIKLSAYSGSPILPVHLQAKSKPAAFKNTITRMASIESSIQFTFQIHELIASDSLTNPKKDSATMLLGRHFHQVARGRGRLLATQKNIIAPEPPLALRAELQASVMLGKTADGQAIYLVDYHSNSAVMREIGRLREYSFRSVGEGTGSTKDLDQYDRYYRHIVLWNEKALELVGAYRFADCQSVLTNFGLSGLYSHALFDLQHGFQDVLPSAVELGRSFVQPKYWGKRSLDYLWFGIGAYLKQHPEVRYLFGPVSLSNRYPELAKQAVTQFYHHHFGRAGAIAIPRVPYLLQYHDEKHDFIRSLSYDDGFKQLKSYLANFGVKVPTLYKQYAEMYQKDGVTFEGFSVDPNFGQCVDALVCADLTQLKPKKRLRYLG